MSARRVVTGIAIGLTVIAASCAVSTGASAAQPSKKYTAAQVAKHATAKDCWTSINGQVYNLTTWIKGHPGGSGPILSICGRDGSSAFNSQHQGQGGPAAMLRKFQIGKLG